MKNPLRFTNCLTQCLLISLYLSLAGCGQKQQPDTTTAAPSASPKPRRSAPPRTTLQTQMDAFSELPYEHDPDRRPLVLSKAISDRREWLVAVLKEGYTETAHTNPQWDAAVHKAFDAYADYSRVADNPKNFSALSNAVLSAIAKGCEDPMLQYMRVRYGLSDPNRTQQEFALAALQAFRSMLLSHYHPVLKFMAGYRAVYAAREAEPKSNRSRPIDHVTASLEDVARDTNAPAGDVFDTASMWMEYGRASDWPAYVMSDLEDILKKTWSHDQRFFQLRGLAEIGRAWKARGTGYSDSVSEQGWEDFRTHLNQAALALETCWSMNPSNAYTAYLMMKVELGQGQSRARMEKWFNRAMNLAPNYYDAVDLMEFYLQPRWYGSDEDALRFARSCVDSTKWGGQVPLVLENLHHSLAGYYNLGDSPNYWQKPGVWEDVKASYDKFFQLNPDNYGYHHNYARDAYLCGQYTEFVAQAKLFPWTNFQFFGGEAEFQKMIQKASSK